MTVLTNLYAKYLTMDDYFVWKDAYKKVELGTMEASELNNLLDSAVLYELDVFLGNIENKEYPDTIKTLCEKHHVITFDELLIKTTEYFKSINGKVEYLFVDEYQDIGPLENNFFISLNADNYFFVGDEKQRNLQF